MTKKFGVMLDLLNNPPKELSLKTMQAYFDIFSEIDDGVRAGRTILAEWLESDNDKLEDSLDGVSTAAISILQFKRVHIQVEQLPEPIKSIAMEKLVAQEMAKMNKETSYLASLSWITGFLLGLEFYKSVIANCDEDES